MENKLIDTKKGWLVATNRGLVSIDIDKRYTPIAIDGFIIVYTNKGDVDDVIKI